MIFSFASVHRPASSRQRERRVSSNFPRYVGLIVCAGLVGCAAPLDNDTDDNRFEAADGVDEVAPVQTIGTNEPSPTQIDCAYPPGTGVAQGQVVPSSTGWEGYAPGSDVPEHIDISQFYDCVGSKGVHAIFYDTSQYG